MPFLKDYPVDGAANAKPISLYTAKGVPLFDTFNTYSPSTISEQELNKTKVIGLPQLHFYLLL